MLACARDHLNAARPSEALHLAESILAISGDNKDALAITLGATEAILEREGREFQRGPLARKRNHPPAQPAGRTCAVIHPRLSVNAMCSFSWSWEQDFALWKSMGLRHAGLLISKLGSDAQARLAELSSSGISISTLITGGFDLSNRDSWEATRAAHRHAVDLVAAENGNSIYFTSGRTVRLDWDEDFALLAEAVAPSVSYGLQKGVKVALEPSQRTSVSFVTTLSDAVDVANETGLAIVADFANCWSERGLAASFKRAAPHLALLQIDDIIIGSTKRPAPVAARMWVLANFRCAACCRMFWTRAIRASSIWKSFLPILPQQQTKQSCVRESKRHQRCSTSSGSVD